MMQTIRWIRPETGKQVAETVREVSAGHPTLLILKTVEPLCSCGSHNQHSMENDEG